MLERRNCYGTTIQNKIIIFVDCSIKTYWKCMCLAILVTLAMVFYYSVVVFDLQIRNIRRCSWDLNSRENKDTIMKILDQYENVTLQFKMLTKKHADLIERFRRLPMFINKYNISLSPLYPGPLLNGQDSQSSMETYETIRRRIYHITNELWYYLNYRLLSATYKKLMPGEKQAILDEFSERQSWLVSWQQQLVSSDGYDEWRRKEAASVSDLVQRRLTYLQNPTDCRTAKKLLCQMDNCGFGCQLHHIAFCLINAYATKRTLVFFSHGWTYNKKGWENVFYPLSHTCSDTIRKEIKKKHRLGKTDSNVVALGTLHECMSNQKKLCFLPYHFPKDLVTRVGRFNGDPASWWIGQMIKYILRPRRHIQKTINETIAKMGLISPVVGVQVRRTDKLYWESEFHNIEEYMSYVGEYFTQLQLTRDVDERRVYIATDAPRVIKKAKRRYKEYTFFGNKSVAKLAKFQETRFSPDSLIGLLVDLRILSLCDYVVCTFTSNLCRIVYELKQANLVDATNYVHSLDFVYYFATEQPNYRTAVKRNKNRASYIDFEIGDQFKMQHWNVTSNNGTLRDGKSMSGPIPLYKTVRQILLQPYPEYPQVPIYLPNKI